MRWWRCPAMGLDRNAFLFSRYDLQVRLDPHQHGLSVEGTVEVRNVSRVPQSQVALQISSSLHWLSVLEDGAEVEWLEQSYTSDIDHTGLLHEAIVKFDKPLAPGESRAAERPLFGHRAKGHYPARTHRNSRRHCPPQRLGRDQRQLHRPARSRLRRLVSGVDGCGESEPGRRAV